MSRARGLLAAHFIAKQLASNSGLPARHQVSLHIRIGFDESFYVLQYKHSVESLNSLTVLLLTLTATQDLVGAFAHAS